MTPTSRHVNAPPVFARTRLSRIPDTHRFIVFAGYDLRAIGEDVS